MQKKDAPAPAIAQSPISALQVKRRCSHSITASASATGSACDSIGSHCTVPVPVTPSQNRLLVDGGVAYSDRTCDAPRRSTGSYFSRRFTKSTPSADNDGHNLPHGLGIHLGNSALNSGRLVTPGRCTHTPAAKARISSSTGTGTGKTASDSESESHQRPRSPPAGIQVANAMEETMAHAWKLAVTTATGNRRLPAQQLENNLTSKTRV